MGDLNNVKIGKYIVVEGESGELMPKGNLRVGNFNLVIGELGRTLKCCMRDTSEINLEIRKLFKNIHNSKCIPNITLNHT